jgi:serine/threonine protein kinase
MGAYPDGRPYYAMRFIRGESMQQAIARFHAADANPRRDPGERSLALRELLTRYVAVCQAVAYAHSRGVIHRDLKPANVMLGEYGETIVVDWGLARILDQPDGERTTAERPVALGSGSGTAPTELGQVVGTPSYMPPEQARGDNDRLGPAADVFALGATLYCLLTGQPPYTGDDVLPQAQRGVVQPARQRKTAVPRALEAVCAKAMSSRPEERYAGARVLAQEVQRWLADEPVEAYRDPALVRLARWGRKNRTLVGTASAALLVTLVALAAGLVVVGGLNRRLEAANASLSKSNARLDESNAKLTEALAETEKQRREAKRERDVAVAVNDFLQNDLLGQADIGNQPLGAGQQGRDPDIKVAVLLDRAAKAIEGKFPGQEETEAAIRRTIGDAYRALGRYEEALPQLQRSVALFAKKLGADHPDTLTSKNNLAELYKA